jgi:Fic family protein
MSINPENPFNSIPHLPPEFDLETKSVLKQLAVSHRYLAELKGIAQTIPNRSILINTLTLQEAKESSAIENIITTHDELYKSDLFADQIENPAAKEVHRYAKALTQGFNLILEDKLLTVNRIVEIQKVLEDNDAGIRKLPGTILKSTKTGETIYTPPDDPRVVVEALSNLEKYINDEEFHKVDPLIKMAVIHYQFESIHPFYDGNGRTGRIINVLYLVLNNLLETPVLYLSRFIIENKSDYYRLLNEVRTKNNWEEWVMFFLNGVQITAINSINLIKEIKWLMSEYKTKIRSELPKIYSKDLLNLLFRHPYTKIDFVIRVLKVTRITATKYLNELTEKGLLTKHKLGRNIYFVNDRLFELFVKK